ncbi:response regulator [Novosphingobium sp. ERN07]|uniref:response regulator n=1 Tax=Novosphingobium sp. ERN07 TaxID=2726187 RepID=UPI00145690AD|nr:response regulator [Novosphingobium sp. ERN07]NLR71307.1 response regulator [Novosphingobium sp. ERN07]
MIEGKRILVVEDEFIVAAMLCDVLEDAGAVPLGPVGRVKEAMEAVSSGGIDAVVLDWNLAGEPSLPIAAALTEHGIPFVIATGYGSVEAPFNDRPILGKPYVSGHLLDKLGAFFAA